MPWALSIFVHNMILSLPGSAAEITYLSLHCHHQNQWFLPIKMGSDESHFNVSLINGKGQSTSQDSVHTPHYFRRERRAEADSNQCPSVHQPNALPLGQTGSHKSVGAVSNSVRTTNQAKHIIVFGISRGCTKDYRYNMLWWWWWIDASCPQMSAQWHIRDKLWPMPKHGSIEFFTSTEIRRLVRTDSPGRPPRLSHSSWTTLYDMLWLYWVVSIFLWLLVRQHITGATSSAGVESTVTSSSSSSFFFFFLTLFLFRPSLKLTEVTVT